MTITAVIATDRVTGDVAWKRHFADPADAANLATQFDDGDPVVITVRTL